MLMNWKNISLLILAAASLARATTINESFTGDPAADGWKSFGDTNLFHWNSAAQTLQVTWDSSRTNSYFYHPLGTVIAKDDDFSLAFDVRLGDIAIGVDPAKPYTFQFTIGFIHQPDAFRPDFIRGTGSNSPNLVEFDYFPDSGFGATISPTLISSNGEFAYSFNIDEMTTNDLFHIEMVYTASDSTLRTTMTRNGEPFGPIGDAVIDARFFTDFRADAVAVCSYSDAGQDPLYAGSILAHGTVDNLSVTVPAPPVGTLAGAFSNSVWQVQFTDRTNWLYTLQRSADFQSWSDVSPATAGAAGSLVLSDANAAEKGFYRVKAERP